jgi:hypothetical protein
MWRSIASRGLVCTNTTHHTRDRKPTPTPHDATSTVSVGGSGSSPAVSLWAAHRLVQALVRDHCPRAILDLEDPLHSPRKDLALDIVIRRVLLALAHPGGKNDQLSAAAACLVPHDRYLLGDPVWVMMMMVVMMATTSCSRSVSRPLPPLPPPCIYLPLRTL